MRTYKLHLIRHGMTEGNENGQYIGLTDIKITTNGIIELENFAMREFIQNVIWSFQVPFPER